ncbi:unnamed protein product [Lymnaea stagnalis]|uniref:Uncharacterized protein n=1 Tax=Lymnaea stagnalis TaxID=6523 RepID=A0AAV2I1E0_LYMST
MVKDTDNCCSDLCDDFCPDCGRKDGVKRHFGSIRNKLKGFKTRIQSFRHVSGHTSLNLLEDHGSCDFDEMNNVTGTSYRVSQTDEFLGASTQTAPQSAKLVPCRAQETSQSHLSRKKRVWEGLSDTVDKEDHSLEFPETLTDCASSETPNTLHPSERVASLWDDVFDNDVSGVGQEESGGLFCNLPDRLSVGQVFERLRKLSLDETLRVGLNKENKKENGNSGVETGRISDLWDNANIQAMLSLCGHGSEAREELHRVE